MVQKEAELDQRFADWKSRYQQEQDEIVLQRQHQFKEQLVKDRDEEIERIIQKLADEKLVQANEKQYRAKLEALQEQHEIELKEVYLFLIS